MSRPTVAEVVRMLDCEATAKEWDALQAKRRGFLSLAEAEQRGADKLREAARLLIVHVVPDLERQDA